MDTFSAGALVGCVLHGSLVTECPSAAHQHWGGGGGWWGRAGSLSGRQAWHLTCAVLSHKVGTGPGLGQGCN